jgi:hypothetical protein
LFDFLNQIKVLSVAFMPMHLGECKRFQKCVQVLSKCFREVSGLFWNLFSFSLSLFYLLEDSKIFFMSTKYFIYIVHAPIKLWEFSWNFSDFQNIFRDFIELSGKF